MAEAAKLSELLREPDILLEAEVETKVAALAAAADRLAQSTGAAREKILKALTDREKLGSTAITRGVAVPHAGLDTLTQPAAVLLRLAKPIEFDAPDNNPVDLVFVMIWPSEKRSGLLATLGGLCRSLREKSSLQELREAADAAEIRAVLEEIANQAAQPAKNN